MKPAKLDGLIRAFEHRDRSNSPTVGSLKVANLPGFKDFEISPQSDFLAVCGGTGTGKTALLELLYAGMGFKAELPERQLHRLGAAQLSVSLSAGDQALLREIDIASEGVERDFPIDVHLLDLQKRTNGPLKFFNENQIAGVAEGSDQYEFDSDYVALCAYICRKDYKSIKVTEVENNDQRYPFFEISTSKTSYDSFSASTGELSVLYLSWALRYNEPFSIFLIEEPEAYLPPIGQAAVIYLLYKSIVDRGHSVLLSTHSAEIVSKIPEEEIISIRSNQGISEIPGTRTSKARVLAKLGLGPSKSAILFVEDEAAKDVVSEILSISPLADLVAFEVVVAGNGDGAVKKATEALPDNLQTMTAIGVLDGDMQPRAKRWKTIERFCFTPFEVSIEEELLNCLADDIESFAERIGRDAEVCRDALEVGEGIEIHERFAQAAKALRTTNKTLRTCAFPVWLRQGDNDKKVEAFIADLATKVGLPKPE